MGAFGGSNETVYRAATTEETVTPAVAKEVSQDTESAQMKQNEIRSRKRGIRSTYNQFASQGSDTAGANGSSAKLG